MVTGAQRMVPNFNPRSRTGSDADNRIRIKSEEVFQSTLPHRERRQGQDTAPQGQGISIHAPAQGATAKGYKKHPFILCKTEKNLLDNFFKDILIQKIV